MKILFITQNFYPEIGSAANRFNAIFKLMNKAGFDAHVVTTIPSYPNAQLFKDSDYFNDDYINVMEVKYIKRLVTKLPKKSNSFLLRLSNLLEEYILLRRYLKKHSKNYHYIYVTSPNIFLAWGTLFFKQKGIKYILEVRDLWPKSVQDIGIYNIKWVMPILKFLENKMYNNADKIVVNNQYFLEHINSRLKEKKDLLYLPNSVLQNEVISANKLVKYNDFTVIYSGNLGYAQDTDKLVEIATLLEEKKINFTTIIYGVEKDRFINKVRDFKYVKIFPPMTRDDCLTEIAKSHVSLSILKNTNTFLNVLPGKVIDAISMGTIPVTNLGGYTNKLINENKLGVSVKNIDSQTLVDKIETFKHDPSLVIEYTNNAKKYRDSNFIWDDNIVDLVEFLNEGE